MYFGEGSVGIVLLWSTVSWDSSETGVSDHAKSHLLTAPKMMLARPIQTAKPWPATYTWSFHMPVWLSHSMAAELKVKHCKGIIKWKFSCNLWPSFRRCLWYPSHGILLIKTVTKTFPISRGGETDSITW